MGKTVSKKCELCRGPANMYCESDEAYLCWSCDLMVHSANSLVPKHSRNLLCHLCQDPTQWFASGRKLGPTMSICDTCFMLGKGEAVDDAGSSDSSTGASSCGGEGRSEGENQVVPRGSSSPAATRPKGKTP